MLREASIWFAPLFSGGQLWDVKTSVTSWQTQYSRDVRCVGHVIYIVGTFSWKCRCFFPRQYLLAYSVLASGSLLSLVHKRPERTKSAFWMLFSRSVHMCILQLVAGIYYSISKNLFSRNVQSLRDSQRLDDGSGRKQRKRVESVCRVN